MTKPRYMLILLASLRISGGVKEALGLAEELHAHGVAIELVVLWKSSHELTPGTLPVTYLSQFQPSRASAALQFPLLLLRFVLLIFRRQSNLRHTSLALMLTHFSTFPFAWIVPPIERYCFSQDVEWMFVKEGRRRSLLRWFILKTCRSSHVFTTNLYVDALYEHEGIKPEGRLSIWPPAAWLSAPTPISSRPIDVVMLLRRGHMKRLDLYFDLLQALGSDAVKALVVTPDPELAEHCRSLGFSCVVRPTDDELRKIYLSSKVLLLLSDTEGFALPPLEAMASGCVPLCRDSGGPRCYMTGALASNLIPLEASAPHLLKALVNLLAEPVRLQQLSDYARTVFLTGEASSKLDRNQALKGLRAQLAGEMGTSNRLAKHGKPIESSSL